MLQILSQLLICILKQTNKKALGMPPMWSRTSNKVFNKTWFAILRICGVKYLMLVFTSNTYSRLWNTIGRFQMTIQVQLCKLCNCGIMTILFLQFLKKCLVLLWHKMLLRKGSCGGFINADNAKKDPDIYTPVINMIILTLQDRQLVTGILLMICLFIKCIRPLEIGPSPWSHIHAYKCKQRYTDG